MEFENIGRYKVIKKIGEGGMATVYCAFDPKFNRKVAIKVLPEALTRDPKFIQRFNREAQAIASLEHPAIVPVYDYGEQNGQPYLVMRHMTGGTLKEYIKRHAPLSLHRATEILARLAPALDKANAEGIVHRDVKPANILFDGEGNPYLSDFGIVKVTDVDTTITGTYDLVGTPAYMSPEQAQTDKHIDGRSDIYSLAVILFEMLTGEQPFKADTPIRMALAHVNAPIPKIGEKRGDLPHTAQEIIQTGLAKEKIDRYPSSNELVAALHELIGTIDRGEAETVDALVTGMYGKTKKKKKWPYLFLGGLGILLVCVGLYLGLDWAIGGFVLDDAPMTDAQKTLDVLVQSFSNPKDQNTPIPTSTYYSFPTDIPSKTPTLKPLDTATPVLSNTPQSSYDLAFASDRDGIFEIYLMNSWTGETMKIPTPPGYNQLFWPTFCGTNIIAFEAQDTTDQNAQAVYLVDLDYPENSSKFINGWAGVPRCSPDGTYIGIMRVDGDHHDLVIYDFSTRTEVFRTDLNQQSEVSGYPTWDQMGNLYFCVSRINGADNNRNGIYTYNNGIAERKFKGSYPALSPNGQLIAYYCGEDDLCVSNIDGSAQEVIADTIRSTKPWRPGVTPWWSADGQWIYFASADEGNWDIYRIHRDGSGKQNITGNWKSNEIMPAVKW